MCSGLIIIGYIFIECKSLIQNIIYIKYELASIFEFYNTILSRFTIFEFSKSNPTAPSVKLKFLKLKLVISTLMH